jgi:hypothetical protein
MSQRPEAGQPCRTVILREKVNESIVIEVPRSRFASTEQGVAHQSRGFGRESLVGTHGRALSVHERSEHGGLRPDKFRRSVTFEQSRQPAIADQPPEVRKRVEVTMQRQPRVHNDGQGAVPEASVADHIERAQFAGSGRRSFEGDQCVTVAARVFKPTARQRRLDQAD